MIKSKKLSKIKNLKHGFFNSIGGKSVNIYKSLGAQPSRQMVTYRYIFNENQYKALDFLSSPLEFNKKV